MKRLVIDLDGTITFDNPDLAYEDKQADQAVVKQMHAYRAAGFSIIIYTARNMRTFDNCIGKINAFTLPSIVDWLNRNDVPYDEIYVGKPWCGTDGFYVDDRAVRPDEFKTMTYEQIELLVSGRRQK